jgi:transposase
MQDDSVDLWATDEVHFQQHGSRCRMWIPPEIKDPVLLHAPTRKSVGYFGAVRLRDGRFVFRLETGKFNGPSFLQFLQQLRSASRGPRRRVVVITDNAPYHHSRMHRPWREKHAQRFALDFLPPYSPELNPIERVWKLTRRRCLHNRYFENLKDIISAVEAEFANWTTRNDVLRPTMRNYLRRYVLVVKTWCAEKFHSGESSPAGAMISYLMFRASADGVATTSISP